MTPSRWLQPFPDVAGCVSLLTTGCRDLCMAPPVPVTLSRGDFWQAEQFYYFLLKIKGILLGLVGKEMNRAFPISCLQLFPQQSVCHKMDFCPNWLQLKITSPHFCQFGHLFTCALCIISFPVLNLCEN